MKQDDKQFRLLVHTTFILGLPYLGLNLGLIFSTALLLPLLLPLPDSDLLPLPESDLLPLLESDLLPLPESDLLPFARVRFAPCWTSLGAARAATFSLQSKQ